MAHREGNKMRFSSNESELSWRARVLRFCLMEGFLVLILVAAAGCGDAEPDVTVKSGSPILASATATTPAQMALTGDGTWALDSLDGSPIIEDSVITVRIDENRLDGVDGCNSYGGRFEDGTLIADADGVFSIPPLAVTEMGCTEPDGVMDQADAYISTLLQGETYGVTGDRLEIIDNDGIARLVFVRDAPLPGRPHQPGGHSVAAPDGG